MADETAWLIERADPQFPNQPLPSSFLGIAGSYDGHFGGGRLQWMTTASDALRFSRQKDAAMFVGMVALLQEDMLLRHTIKGLRDGEPRALVIEHLWVNGAGCPMTDYKPHKTMTPEEYAAMPIIGWHEVCRNVDGCGGIGIRFLSSDNTCDRCDGTGNEPGYNRVCEKCGGSGSLTSERQKMRQPS